MSARLIRWQSAHLTDLLLIKSVWKIRKNSLKWEVASNWHLTFFGWNSPKKYVFTRIFYKSTEFPTNRKKLDYSPPLILKLKFIAFIIFLQNSNRSNMCAAIAQRRLVIRKFQIEENMRIVALKSTQKMPRRICAARCWKCPARNTCVFVIEMFLMSEAFFAELIFTIVTHNVSRMFCECSNEICVLNASRFG